MRFWIFGAFASLALVSLVGMRGFSQATAQPMHPHHHLHHALWELRDAHKELHETKANFGGHKEKAMHAIHAAITQLDLILKHHGDKVTGAPTRGDLTAEYKKYAHHPHLHHALAESKHAHRQIKESRHDFGGHREAALRDINHAIVQVELCLKHHKKA